MTPPISLSKPQEGRVRAIILVRTPGYVPPGVTVRSRIDETMFTGELDSAGLDAVISDAEVISVSQATPMRLVG